MSERTYNPNQPPSLNAGPLLIQAGMPVGQPQFNEVQPVVFVEGSQCSLCPNPAVMLCQGIQNEKENIKIYGCSRAVCKEHKAPDSFRNLGCTKSDLYLCVECGLKELKCRKIRILIICLLIIIPIILLITIVSVCSTTECERIRRWN